MSALGVNRICRDGGSDVNDPKRSFDGRQGHPCGTTVVRLAPRYVLEDKQLYPHLLV